MFSNKYKWICTSGIGTVKKKVDVHYLNSSFIGRSAAVVLEHFNSCVESIEKKQQNFTISSGGPNVNLSFLKILDEHRRDTEHNPLIDFGT